MPDYLIPKYQNFTEANISKLKTVGYGYEFFDLKKVLKII